LSRSSAAFEPCRDAEKFRADLERIWGFEPSVLDDYRFWQRVDGGPVWIAAASLDVAEGEKYEAVGMIVCREVDHPERLDTSFILRFGHLATRSLVQIDSVGVDRFLAGLTLDDVEAERDSGYVIVCSGSTVVGRGRIREKRLIPELPKSWMVALGAER
jgi:hypothetical protein